MISCDNAEKALKNVYLETISRQINTTTTPFYNMVEAGSEGINGKDFEICTNMGISGGIGCAADDGDLPNSGVPAYYSFKAPLVNIYGKVEITDKALKSSLGDAGKAVELLNFEMQSLVDAAKFNFGRMLYQDGKGILCRLVGDSSSATSYTSTLYVDSTKNVCEGMLVDVYKAGTVVNTSLRITLVDRINKKIVVAGQVTDLTEGNIIALQGAYGKELYGLEYNFLTPAELGTFYNNVRNNLSMMLPMNLTVNEVDGDVIQEVVDMIEERSGGNINLILASYDMRRKYLAELRDHSLNVDYMNLDGGYKSLSYNGIPVYADRFVPENTMYFVNTADFRLGQLCDWTWIENADGKVLRQLENKAAYGATLVKYANLICKRPIAQAKIVYEEAVEEPEVIVPESPAAGEGGN